MELLNHSGKMIDSLFNLGKSENITDELDGIDESQESTMSQVL